MLAFASMTHVCAAPPCSGRPPLAKSFRLPSSRPPFRGRPALPTFVICQGRAARKRLWAVPRRFGASDGAIRESLKHEFGEIYGTRARLRAERAIAGCARGASAVYARAYPEGAARRRGGSRRGPDRQGGRALARRADASRTRAQQIAESAGLGRRAALSRADDGARCSTMPRRSRRRPAIPSSPSSACSSRWRWRRAPRRAGFSPTPA